MKLTIELPSYNLSVIQGIIIKKLLKDNPGLTVDEYSTILNVSSRSFYRYQHKYSLKIIDRVKCGPKAKILKSLPRMKRMCIHYRIKSFIE